jgi:hypothetical protein
MADLIIKPSVGNLILKDDQNVTRVSIAPTTGVTTLSNQVFPAGHIVKWEQVTTTPVATQGADETYTDLTGSSKAYTPATGASYVVYEYTTTINGDGNDPQFLPLFWFNYDGSTVANTNHIMYGTGTGTEFSVGYKSWKFILPAWSGAKTMSISYRAYGSEFTSFIHKSPYSGAASGTDVFTKIYQTTFSVM